MNINRELFFIHPVFELTWSSEFNPELQQLISEKYRLKQARRLRACELKKQMEKLTKK